MRSKASRLDHTRVHDRFDAVLSKNLRLNRRDALKYLLGGAAAVAFGGLAGLNLNLPEAHATPVSAVGGFPTYIVQQNGGIVTATRASRSLSGLTPSSLLEVSSFAPDEVYGTDAATVIMQACLPNAKVLIKSGTYDISKTIVIKNPNVELYGESKASTILHLNDKVIKSVLAPRAANGFHIHDLQVDGNRENQPYKPPYPQYDGPVNIHGISPWNCSSGLIENCFIHDCRSFGIGLSLCTDCTVQNNYVQNSDANGITVDNENGGSGQIVTGNIVDGASDVGITGWDAVNYTAQNNTVKNVTMNTSPFEQNSHVGMMAEGSSTGSGSNNCKYTGNMISNVTGAGMWSAPSGGENKQITFNNNNITNCGSGIGMNHNIGFTATNNVINGSTSKLGLIINVGSDASSISIEQNQILNLPTALQSPIVNLLSATGIFTNNTIHTNGNSAMYVKYPAGWITSPNTITT